MESRDRIIVLQKFDSVIDANIVKTKLDAYGIPCFLTGENLTHLTTSLLSGGVSLHIFEADKDQVIQLLLDESLRKTEDDDLQFCPICHSKKILTLSSNRLDPASVVKFMLQLTKKHYCIQCQNEFD